LSHVHGYRVDMTFLRGNSDEIGVRDYFPRRIIFWYSFWWKKVVFKM